MTVRGYLVRTLARKAVTFLKPAPYVAAGFVIAYELDRLYEKFRGAH